MTNNNFNIRSYIESLSLNIYFVKWEEKSFIDNVDDVDKLCNVELLYNVYSSLKTRNYNASIIVLNFLVSTTFYID